MGYRRPLLLVTVAVCVATLARAAVFSIDYGTDWFKVALVQGKTFDIVLNIDSQRKTSSAVGVRDVIRSFANDALNLGTMHPSQSYPALKPLLGRRFHDEHCRSYRDTFQNTMREDPERGTAVFSHTIDGNDVELSVEELVGMQFAYARKITEEAANGTVRDVVITVPPYFTQFERQAILDAAEIAGLHVIQLIHDNTAVALNYALGRTFTETPAHHIFYDSGAGSTVASLISFSNIVIPLAKGSRFNKTVAEIEVRAIGFDRTLGGNEIDVRIQRWLAEEFAKQQKGKLKGDVFKDQRAMMKLLKEAKRLKQILSANVDTQSSIVGLMEDIDFRTKITRDKLEQLCSDLVDRVTGPLDAVMEKTGLTKTDIESLVLVGGNVRVPSIQEQLKKYIGAEKIAKNVNGDEAAAMGAAFRAAALSRQFTVPKDILIKEINPYPIEISYPIGDDGRPVTTVMYNDKAIFGLKKIMNFNKEKNFAFTAAYGVKEDEKTFGPKEICSVEVDGVAEAIEKHQNMTNDKPKVKVMMKLTDSGMFTAEEGFVEIETLVTDKSQSLKDKVISFLGGGSEKNETVNPGTNATNSSSTNAGSADKPERMMRKVQVALKLEPRGIPPLSKKQKEVAISRLKRMDQSDHETKAREEARNNLEAFLYRVQDWMYNDGINIVSTEQQREELTKRLSEASDWLYEEGDRAVKEEIAKWLEKLKSLERPIAFRLSEHTNRPKAISNLRDALSQARQFIAERLTPESSPNSAAEKLDLGEVLRSQFDSLLKMVNETEHWLTTNELAQSARQLVEDAVFTSADVRKRIKEVEAGSGRLQTQVKVEEEKLRKKLEKEAKEAKEAKVTKEAEAEPRTDGDTTGKHGPPLEQTETSAADSADQEGKPEKHDEL